MKIHLLEYDNGDYYTLYVALEAFTSREQAEQAIEGLIGKPRVQSWRGEVSSLNPWSATDFEITEFELR